MPDQPNINITDLIERFHSDDECRKVLEELRWPSGVACIKCGSMSVSRISTRDQFDCNGCRHRFSVTSDTIMHDTHLPLWKWFMAIYLTVEGKKGISARQLGRTLGVARKTSWYLAHRIREALKTPDALLSGIIEVDETWIGGAAVGKGRHYMKNKSLVAGAVQRDGDIRLKHVPSTSKKVLHKFIGENISDDVEAIYTDEWPGYNDIADENTRHETVNHSIKEYARGDVHTNTVEGVWALFKRGVVGSFHGVSRKHLERYLDEFEFRFNNRDNPFIYRDALREIVHAPRLTFAELIS
ncbi:MAG: IS1595 family transposase, partial [Chloroflexi bacterium]|nr:IS1595 family transposase [Chloroflexota bacterium]